MMKNAQVAHRDWFFTFCFANGEPCSGAEEAVFQKYIRLIGGREKTNREGMLGDDRRISVTVRWKELWVAVGWQTHHNTVYFSWDEFVGKSGIFLTLSQVGFALHSQLWHLQSVYKAVRVSSSKQLAWRGFNLGKAQQRRTLAGGRSDAQEGEEETEEVPCGWNDDSSSNFVTLRQKWTESSKVPQESSLRCYWHFQHSIRSFIVYFGERLCV